ncbi:MAG: hypothetical protein K8I03_02270 [Ignavibacteria bacterium]|nr:hypothetical protein [Ignavibacteria bacterium]
MKTLINISNLWKTVDNLSGALFAGQSISLADKKAFEALLEKRHHMEGRYNNMYALTPKEIAERSILFTGEAITSNASKRHIIGEDASRTLGLLKPSGNTAKRSLHEGDKEMSAALKGYDGRKRKYGMYCCFNCSLSLWRNLASGGIKPARTMLSKGMASLKLFRDGKGRWNGFLYYNTLYTLSLVDLSLSRNELLYTLPLAEALYKKLKAADKYTFRRKLLIEKIMNKL